MAIDKDLILKLRNASHAGFSDCKKALEENNNDLEASIKWLRMKGIAKANNKNALKSATEGGTWVKKDAQGAVIIELNSETDFTANNQNFALLAQGIMDVILQHKPKTLGECINLKMPNGESIEENCLHLSSITGEKIVLARMQYFALDSNKSAACYRHSNGKMSSMLILDKNLPDGDILGLAVHYAANNPKFVSANDVDENWIKEEQEVIMSNLAKENKPEQFRQKIVDERIKKLIAQVAFLEQAYLYDSSKTVKDVLDSLSTKVLEATCWHVGDLSGKTS